jgi:tetratricopeptide (TPR) repeat protein
MFAIAAEALLSGCASTHRPTPYQPSTDAERRPDKAERLNQQAAAIIDSDPARAEILLREALAADLYHGPAHNNLGTLYLAQGKVYDAVGEFQFARQLLPGSPDPRMNLALALERAGWTSEALSAYGTALEVRNEYLPAIQGLTRLQVKSGRTDDKTAGYMRQIAISGDTSQWRDWAREWLASRGE